LAKHNDAPDASADGVTDVVSEEDKAKQGQYTSFYKEFGAVLKKVWVKTLATAIAWPNCCALLPRLQTK